MVALEFPGKDMEVDVGYGLPRSLAVLEMVDEFRTAKSLLRWDYLTCYGERVCTVFFFNDTTDMLDGTHEGR